MENAKRFVLKLLILRSYYIENGEEHETNVPYLFFNRDGTVSLDGEDEEGTFSFSGHSLNDYLYLVKKYHGKHTIYYVGKLEGNFLYLVYDLEGDYNSLLQKLKNQEYMGGMEFAATIYKVYLDSAPFSIFLSPSDKSNEFKGLGLIDGKVSKVLLSGKEGKWKLKVKSNKKKTVYKVDVDMNDNMITYTSSE